MSETITNNEVVVEAPETTQPTEVATQATQLQAAFWEDKPSVLPTQEVTNEPPKTEPVTSKENESNEEVIDENEFYTREFGKTKDDFKKEYDELLKFKTEKPQEINWANEESKKVHELLRQGKIDEVMSIYNKQKQIEKYLSSEVNPQTAEDILKLQMKLKYEAQGLTDDEIDFQFRQNYGTPKEPVYNELKETEEEFTERHNAWKEQVANIEKRRTIDAKMAIPELQKLKTELVFPDTSLNSNSQNQRQPTQEELAADKKMKEEWAKAASMTATNFKGLATTAKYKDGDKEVEIPVSYGLAPEEIKTLTTKLSAFAENNFDPYTILKERWVDDKGNDKLDQMVEDLSWLMFGKNAAQKFANDAANQRMENYLKEKKNIRIDGGGGKDFGSGAEQKSSSEKLQEAFWNS